MQIIDALVQLPMPFQALLCLFKLPCVLNHSNLEMRTRCGDDDLGGMGTAAASVWCHVYLSCSWFICSVLVEDIPLCY